MTPTVKQIYYLIVAFCVVLTVHPEGTGAEIPALATQPPLSADDVKSGFRIAAWNIEHLGMSGESCLERTKADFDALRAYTNLLDADVVAIQEIESREALRQVFREDEYNLVLAERFYVGERPLCWWVPSRVEETTRKLGNHFTGFAIRKGVEFEQHAAFKAVGNLREAGGHASYGSDVTVRTPAGPIRLLGVHLLWGCSAFGDSKDPECDAVMSQAAAINSWLVARSDESVAYAVLGDFNHPWEPASPYWRTMFGPSFRSNGFAASAENLLEFCSTTTRPTPAVGRRPLIDHVFLFGDVTYSTLSFGQIEFVSYDQRNFKLSDHCPVFVEISGD